jgi:predicted dinucleotide-binding enzyme
MMDIAILGTGNVATTLGGGLVAAGHTVVLGSRDPGAVQNPQFPVLGHAEAIGSADVVVSAIAGPAALETLEAIGADLLAGKVLLDLGNAVTPEFELMYPNDSLAERIQRALPETKVVKTLNTLGAPLMVAPATIPPSTVFLSGDDDEAKATVGGLLGDLGWPADTVLDLGGIASARGPEHYFLLFAAIWQATGSPVFNINIARA